MKQCIVNVSIGTWHPRGQDRLIESLKYFGYTGGLLLYRNEYPFECPTHQQVPYAFKTYAMKEAQRQGYDVLLWLDASMRAIRNPADVFHHIETQGHLFEYAGHVLGWWSTDAFLAKHNLTRDEAMKILMFSAGFTGLDLRNPKSVEFLDRWHNMAQDGVSFIGPWYDSGTDPNYKGHRHDMSAASLIAHQLEMKIENQMYMLYDCDNPNPPPETCFLAQGML